MDPRIPEDFYSGAAVRLQYRDPDQFFDAYEMFRDAGFAITQPVCGAFVVQWMPGLSARAA